MKDYKAAAEKYRLADKEVIAAQLKQACELARNQLRDFLDQPLGKEAKDMLRASKKSIEFGLTKGAHSDIKYFLDGSGTHMSYMREDDSPHTEIVEILEAVTVAVENAKCAPENFMRWLGEELDKIADAAPEPSEKQA